MSNHRILLDIMLHGRFICQMRYEGHGRPMMNDEGEIVEVYDDMELRAFVEQKKPSLRGKDYVIEFTDRSVFKI